MASLDVTYECNLRCRMCNVWKIRKKEKQLSLIDWRKIVDQLVKTYSVRRFRLVGGEPFVSNDIRELIHHIKSKGLRLEIVTNGTLITKEIASFLISEHVERIRISIDGLKEIDEFYRGKNSFSETMKGINILMYEIKDRQVQAPKLSITPFVSKVNYRDIDALQNIANQNKIDFGYFYLRGETEANDKRIKDPGFPEKPEYPSIITAREKRAFEKRILSHLSWQKRTVHALISKVKNFPIWRDCPRIASHLIIDPWGYIFPCENLYEYPYGNCMESSIKEIWESRNRTILRQNVRRGSLQACLECGHRVFWPSMIFPAFIASNITLIDRSIDMMLV